MKYNSKKKYTFLAVILILFLIALFINMKSSSGSKKKAVQARKERDAQMNMEIQPIPLPQQNTRPDVNVLPTIPPMPTAADMHTDNVMIANFPDLDRMPLDTETIALLPANEMIANNYKDWYGAGASGAGASGAGASACTGDSVDKELYANGKPLFDQTGKKELVPLDVNGEKRRVNFY